MINKHTLKIGFSDNYRRRLREVRFLMGPAIITARTAVAHVHERPTMGGK